MNIDLTMGITLIRERKYRLLKMSDIIEQELYLLNKEICITPNAENTEILHHGSRFLYNYRNLLDSIAHELFDSGGYYFDCKTTWRTKETNTN